MSFLQPSHTPIEVWENSVRFPSGLTFHGNDRVLYHVPPTFWSNGASIPWWARWAVGHNLDRKNRRPGHLHDFLVTKAERTGKVPVSRERAAKLFREALKSEGKLFVGRWLMWAAVYVDAAVRRVTGKL
jgi:hypothetical protein